MNAVGQYAAKKVLGEQMNKYRSKKVCGNEDPYYELVPTGRKGKMKKVKRRIPDYIPEHDAQILADVRNYAYKLDMALFTFMGVRFGWSSVIGLVPEIGDVIDLFFAVHCLDKIQKVDCPLDSKTLNKMRFNIGVDFLVGLVPFVGDMFDAGWKCNTKNAVLLSQALDKHYAKDAQGQELDKRTRKRQSRQLFEDDPDFGLGPPPYHDEPVIPDPPAAPKETSSSWLGGWSKRERVSDPERA